MTKTILYTFLFMLAGSVAFGQQKQVQSSIDSTKIRIGSQFHLTLKTTVDTNATVSFPQGKNFGQLEVLEDYPVDTLRKGAVYELIKKYGLTQFDSGRYVIPPLPVIINNQNIRTDSLSIEVANIEVDTLKQKMYDIKPIAKAESGNRFWLYIALGLLLLAGIAFGIRWFLKKRKKQPKAAPVVYATPIEKATAQLKNLEQKGLLERGEVKDYYSELTDIARTYIEEAVHVPAMESTTTELIEAMRYAVARKKMRLSQETFEQLEKVLRTADMVKFAKSKPLNFEIAEDRGRIEKTIVVIDRSIPVEVEEEDLEDLARQEMLRKKKEKERRRVIIWSSAGVAAVLLIAGIWIFSDFLQDSLWGRPTKELLEGQWVKSEYGDPGVTIETPKVLKRMDAEQALPKDAMAMIKEMNMFGYGALFDDLYIMVSTAKYKQQVDIDLEKGVDGVVKIWEGQGARNILLKTEEFSTPSGINGLRTYGTMTLPEPVTNKPVRAYYELFFFKQDSGLQQVIILHREGDKYASEILERIKNSIELRNLNQP